MQEIKFLEISLPMIMNRFIRAIHPGDKFSQLFVQCIVI